MPNHVHPRPIDHGFPRDERAEWPTFDNIANATYGPPGPPTISVTEAARMLGISRTTAYEAVRDTLPSIFRCRPPCAGRRVMSPERARG